mgnify:CR=1 FL=1
MTEQLKNDETDVSREPFATGRRPKGPSKQTITRGARRHRSETRKARKRLLYGIGGGLIALALITGLVLPSVGPLGSGDSSTNSSPTANGAAPSVGTFMPIQSGEVIVEGAIHDGYSSLPPTSGPRYANAVEWGSYDEQQPDEAVVRNLEEGGIVVNHNLTDSSEIENLRSFIEKQPGYPGCFLLQPYLSLPSGSVTITSWGWRDSYSSVDRGALQNFIEDHRNAAPLYMGTTCGADTELPAAVSPDHNTGS